MAKDAPAMRGERSRDENGRLRDKRDDTLVRTIEKKYGLDFGVRGDMQLGTLLDKQSVESLDELLRKHRS